MKIAIVYNRESRNVINLFGTPNQERIGLKTIARLADALKEGGHQVVALEGDKELISRIEEFMPRVLKGERPGLVFNVSYGIQGQARYTHVPSILEMVGMPYVGSGPLAHSLALDKVVTKMILRQVGLPTPAFAVLDAPDAPAPDLPFPLIVKPKNEAVSFGLRIVNDEAELREGARVIFERFRQPVLVEQYIDGREINVGILGNSPPEAFAPVELSFGEGGPEIYTYEDKTGRSGRVVTPVCPANISEDLQKQAQEIAKRAFTALGCSDCARVDMRMDRANNIYILEVNSLPSLGEHGSYLVGAAHAGLDFKAFVNRLVEVASARYFGTPHPPRIAAKKAPPDDQVFSFLTERRDQLERRLREWVRLSSRTTDPVGLKEAVRTLEESFAEMGLESVSDLTDRRVCYTWQTRRGFDGGTLFIGHLDVPLDSSVLPTAMRKEPEVIRGEGIASSRAPLVMLEFALQSLRHQRRLRNLPIGVLYYTDEGRDCRYSAELIRRAAARASRVLVLRPGNAPSAIITQRRGQRKYRLTVEGKPMAPGRAKSNPEVLAWVGGKMAEMGGITSRRKYLSVSALDLQTSAYPMQIPHHVVLELLVTYLDPEVADTAEQSIRQILGRRGPHWTLELISDRPPMRKRASGGKLLQSLRDVAARWEIPLTSDSSVWPSAAGLVPTNVDVVCGIGPVGQDLYSPHESIQRISFVQRTLLIAEFLAQGIASR